MKTSGKSPAATRTANEKTYVRECLQVNLQVWGSGNTDSMASETFIILFYFYDFFNCELESLDNS